MTSYSRAERIALCDLFDESGPEAPTLCTGWTTRDLAAHLFVRERRPLAAPGILLEPLSQIVEQSMDAAQDKHGYPQLIAKLRGGAPYWSPFRLLDSQLNLLEYFVHHEDVRRAQPGWTPRELPMAEQDELWSRLKGMVRLRTTKGAVGILLQRADTGDVLRIRTGNGDVTMVGPVGELVMYAFGRKDVARIDKHPDPQAGRREDP
ncbi:MAG: TIGR03085 family metal-binding protein [Mycobacteriales bacterium]